MAELLGGAFLFNEVGSRPIATTESLTEEQRQLYSLAKKFVREQVMPRVAQIEKKEPGLLRTLLQEAGELGLLGIDVPDAYGGASLDKVSSMLAADAAGMMGSWSVTLMAHTGIGTLPIVWFGSAEQKQRYLPALASGQKIAAYALTEQGSGSDALGAKTRAVLSPDGKHYLLTGSKLYITNAAFADVYTVFAKVNGEQFTAFIVDRDTPGLTVGPEEHKLGLRGSSTCPLYFEDARVPVENLLGEVGKGHKVAFNILNWGRLKLGGSVLGAVRYQLESSARFVSERRQFGVAIGSFALTREKLARMAVLLHAVESMVYRTAGLIDSVLAGAKGEAEMAQTVAAVEEYAIESSILKVFGSEAYFQVADDAVQVHGGAGFIEEYAPERAYRDNRVNRIFEGTNEINRLLICTMLLKRAAKGGLPLQALAALAEKELSPPRKAGLPLAAEAQLAEQLKRTAALCLQTAATALGNQLDAHQEVLASVADIVMDAYAMDSMVARTQQAANTKERVALTQLYAVEARARGLERARKALCASVTGAALKAQLDRLAPLAAFEPYDPVGLREIVVKAIEAAGSYPLEPR